ncbi:ABC transporter permease subunit [Actinomycetes bacterium KLBMP 9797]
MSADRGMLLGETVVLDDVGPARRGRAYPSIGTATALLLPAALLLGVLVFWPVLHTGYLSVTDAGRFVGLAHFRTALAEEGGGTVLGRTLLWAAVVPAVVTALGFLLAAASRRTSGGRIVTLILVAPIALPLVVTGVTFRLLYDPDPSRGTATWLTGALWLGPEMITLALMTAFVWAWVGLAVLVFRAAFDALPQSLADAVRAYGGSRLDVFRDARWRPLLRRTVAVVFALVALATSRTFDLILVMAPGPALDEATVLSLRIWQTAGGSVTGPSAALGVLWLAVLTVGTVGAALWSRQAWPPPAAHPAQPPPAAQKAQPPQAAAPETAPEGVTEGAALRAPRLVRRLVLPAAAVWWAIPLVVLVATSLHAPRAAATRGWWTLPLGLGSYRDLFADGGLARSLALTAALAAVVTVAVLGIALLAAYALAWHAPPGGHVAGVVLLGAAVVPVQVVAGPLTEVLDRAGLAGTFPGLALVHVALGVPFAVLLLRNALTDVPLARVRQARLAGRREWSVLARLAPATVPAVVAVCVLEFVQVWNDFVVGLHFGGPDAAPLGLALFGQTRQFVANSGLVAAGSVVASVLPLVLVIAFRRQIVAGLVSGALK